MLPPPPPPVKPAKVDTYREKLLNKVEKFEGSSTEELEKKTKKSEDKDPTCFAEAEGTGIDESEKIDKTKCIQCERCEQWIFLDVINSHKIAHSTRILDWLYLGAENNAANFIELTKRTNISYILNVSRETQDYFPKDFIYKHLYIRDEIDEDISVYFDECFQFIEKCRQEGKNILVHCIMGASRSASIVLYYLMRGEKYPLKKAFEYAKEKRPVVRPNPRFAQDLVKAELEIFGKNSLSPVEINNLAKFFNPEQMQIIETNTK